MVKTKIQTWKRPVALDESHAVWGSNPERDLVCPACGSTNLHHVRGTQEWDAYGKPTRIRIGFWCEQCPDRRYTLVLEQYKGVTHVTWELTNEYIPRPGDEE